MTRTIAVVTGTRADYGLLHGVLQELQADADLALRLMVTGAHLEERFGATLSQISADGFAIDDCIPLHMQGDGPAEIARAMAAGLEPFVQAFLSRPSDIVLVLGDRYETFMAAQAATLCRLPIGHIHGGERTEGAMDEAFRHAITKMAHLHFAACAEYRGRIIQLGEQPDRVFDVGAPGVDTMHRLTLADLDELEDVLGLPLSGGFLLVTYHPVTLERDDGVTALTEMLEALDAFPDLKLVVTGVNADPGHDAIAQRLQSYADANRHRARLVPSLGQRRYLGAMKLCRAVVGNSSSGIIEAPAFRVPSVNIGPRQQGRVRAATTIDCDGTGVAIRKALETALSEAFRAKARTASSPYGEGGAARRIVDILRGANLQGILHKPFFDLRIRDP